MDASDTLARRSRDVITLAMAMAGAADGNGGEMSGMGPFVRFLDWSHAGIVHEGNSLNSYNLCA
jgi:hypothetical protein